MGRRSRYLNLNNAGTSLIEVIIVIAILGVLAGGASLGLSLAFSRDAEKCASKLNDVLAEARTYTMSKDGSFSLIIKKEGEQFTASIMNEAVEYQKMNLEGENKSIAKIEVGEYGESLEELSSSTECVIVFDKTKGNVVSCKVGSEEIKGIAQFAIESERGTESNKHAEVALIIGTGKHKVGGFD